MSTADRTIIVFVKLALALMASEAIVMGALRLMPPLGLWDMMVDPMLLAIITAPVIYLYVLRPLRWARLAAERADQVKSRFLANMSHEIRTPMGAILGYAELLADGCMGRCAYGAKELRATVRIIQRNGDHLLSIINEILDLSKIEAERMTVEQIRCSPHQIVAEVASLVQVRAAENAVLFNVEFVGSVPETIRTDPLRVRQILVNLVNNAIKFTPKGMVRLLVRLDGDAGNTRIQFDVIDNGMGMTQEQAAQVFQPFRQADASTTRQFGGTGLGLTISKRLAQLLGGDVVLVDSAPGLGTRFRATVSSGPLDCIRMIEGPANQEAVTARDGCTHWSGPRIPEGTPLEGTRLLLVEDGPDNRRLISHILSRAGATVEVADNGRIGVDLALAASASGNAYDVILMDMQMPEMDGYDASRHLRAVAYSGPIIALTAHAMLEDCQKCLAAGCDEYASKPINRAQLIETIRKHACNPHRAPEVPV